MIARNRRDRGFVETAGSRKLVFFTAADVCALGRHRSSKVSHQHAVEFLFLFGAVIVTPGL